MKIFLGLVLMTLSGALVAYEHFNLEVWRTPPAERASQKWKSEIQKISAKSKQLKTAFLLIAKIDQTTTDQQFKEMIDQTESPFKVSSKGTYTLKLQFMPWIEDMKYGFLIQHELFDSKRNKITEFNVNIDIGKLW